MQLFRLEQQGESAQCREANATREAAEALHRHDIDRREAGRGVQPQSDRSTRECREPQVVPERVGNERREHHARVAHGLAQVAQRRASHNSSAPSS